MAVKRGKQGRRGKKRKNDNSKLFFFFIGALLFLGLALYYISGQEIVPEYPTQALETERGEPAARVPERAAPVPEELPAVISLPRLAIIIDDIGYNSRFRDLIDIGLPITLAVIPFTPYALEAAEKGNSAGLDIILHLPMEPKGYPATDPGKGAILSMMSRDDILNQLRMNIDAVPNIKGVNNHMGSGFTESSRGMKIVLGEIKKRGLFFVDSKTSVKSVAFSMAREMDVPTAERSVFLDNVQTEEAIHRQLMEAVKIAKSNGQAVAIGHPYESTVNVLKRTAPLLKDEGVDLVFASDVIR